MNIVENIYETSIRCGNNILGRAIFELGYFLEYSKKSNKPLTKKETVVLWKATINIDKTLKKLKT